MFLMKHFFYWVDRLKTSTMIPNLCQRCNCNIFNNLDKMQELSLSKSMGRKWRVILRSHQGPDVGRKYGYLIRSRRDRISVEINKGYNFLRAVRYVKINASWFKNKPVIIFNIMSLRIFGSFCWLPSKKWGWAEN